MMINSRRNLLIYLFLIPLFSFSQDSIHHDSIEVSTYEIDSIPSKPNRHHIKLNIPSLAIATFSFQYEFFPVNFMSISIGYKFTPNRGLFFTDWITRFVKTATRTTQYDDPISNFVNDLTFNGNAFTPEVRFYLGEGFGQGLYLGPFLRFDRYNFDSDFNFESSIADYNMKFEGDYTAFGLGLNLGFQYPINKHLSIDASMGPYISNVKIDFKSVSGYTLTNEELIELQEQLNDFDIPGGQTDIHLTPNSAKVSLKDNRLANLKCGLAISYHF